MPAHHDAAHHTEDDERLEPAAQAVQQRGGGLCFTNPRMAGQFRHGQQRQQGQHGDDGNVLKEQHGKCALASRAAQQALFSQRLQHDGGGGRGHHAASRHRHLPRHVEGHAQTGHHGHGTQHLQPAQPQQLVAQPPERGRLQLHAYQKEHHHHAEFGHFLDFVGFAAHQPQHGADDDAGNQVAQDGAEPQAFGNGHRHDGGEQIDEGDGQE